VTGAGLPLDIIEWNTFTANNVVAIFTGQDNYAGMVRFGTIIDVIVSMKGCGTTGTTIVDILRGTGTLSTTPYSVTFGTIFTTAGNRPFIGATTASTNRTRNTAAPDITAFKKGDVFACDVVQAPFNATGLRVELIVQYTGT
jgi:hypothetical protein